MAEQPSMTLKQQVYSLFLGCVIPNRFPMYEKATRVIMQKLNVELKNMEGASCCPAPGAVRSVDNKIWSLLGARNITIAENNKADIMALCNGCYGTLSDVNHSLKTNAQLAKEINDDLAKINRHYDGSINVKHIMEILVKDISIPRIKAAVTRPLGLNVAIHYGCHLLSPSSLRPFGGNFENPRFFDDLVEACGCKSLDYQERLLCCGAGGGVRGSYRDISLEFTHQKVHNMREAGADCIAVACPFCALQFDLGQNEINEIERKILDPDEPPYKIPVIYVSQLIGLAMGIDAQELGLIKVPGLQNISPFTDTSPLLSKLKPMPVQTPTEGGAKI
nr:CoB--CoM heterodisulfide reductase subunit B [Candidatus Sigynarchaeota archaeon]